MKVVIAILLVFFLASLQTKAFHLQEKAKANGINEFRSQRSNSNEENQEEDRNESVLPPPLVVKNEETGRRNPSYSCFPWIFNPGCYFNKLVDWKLACKTNTLGWEQCEVLAKEEQKKKEQELEEKEEKAEDNLNEGEKAIVEEQEKEDTNKDTNKDKEASEEGQQLADRIDKPKENPVFVFAHQIEAILDDPNTKVKPIHMKQ